MRFDRPVKTLFSVTFIDAPKPEDIRQKRLAKFCYWQEFDQLLWVDARQVFPELEVFKLPSWEWMIMDSEPVPNYPVFLKPLEWPKTPEIAPWLKQIPVWVAESCRLFPSHQMTLLHYVGKYPQLLELLDHAPYLAWRLVTSKLQEPEIVALLSGKRQHLIEQIGWPGYEQTLKFLQNLRLRQVNSLIIEQVETCVLDPQRLQGLKTLPRINSMALTLAARFPEMIGCKLHLSLAKQPCQPMQCQSMIALLEDVFRFAQVYKLDEVEVEKIRHCLYLTQVHEIYLQWIKSALSELDLPVLQSLPASKQTGFLTAWSALAEQELADFIARCNLGKTPTRLESLEQWQELSVLQEHAWWPDVSEHQQLFVWVESADKNLVDNSVDKSRKHLKEVLPAGKPSRVDGLWAALLEIDSSGDVDVTKPKVNILRIRGLQNRLPQAKQLSDLHLFLANL